MRVLLIDVNCQKSSTGKIVYDLYQRLREDGHEAAICYGRGDIVEDENIFKFGLDTETKIHAGLARLTGLNGYFSHFSTQRLLKFINEFRPDVVHIHELHAYFVNHAPLINYLKEKKIKVIWTFHCEYMYTGKCGYAYECEKWKTECGDCPAVKDYPKSLFFDFTKKMFRDKKALLEDMDLTIVTPSAWLADRVKQSFLKDKPIHVVHNGIDAKNIFYPRSRESVNEIKMRYGMTEKKIVLSVAPNIMSERKGGQIVLEIANRFSDNSNIHFVLVGADENGTVGNNVTLVKRTADQNELAVWYSAADVFLICSKKETFSMTCAEALCCGTPVVGYKSGAPETVFNEPNAIFIEQGDMDGLISIVRKQLEMMETNLHVIAETSSKLYSSNAMFQLYFNLYC